MVAVSRRFDYPFASIGDLRVETTPDRKTGRPIVSELVVDGEPIKPTSRFWISLYGRYGFNNSIFKYFGHEEVFRRISEVEPRDRVRLCVEREVENGESRLLAISNPAKPIVNHDSLMETLERYDGRGISYCDGVVESTHTPRIGSSEFAIGGDEFRNRYVMSTPIDGYGQPSIYLSLLRQICTNGMIGYAPAFRSTLALGRGNDDVMYSIIRALDGFGNDEGYAALRQRFEAAAKSWASVYEAQSLYRLLVKLLTHRHIQGWHGTGATTRIAELPMDTVDAAKERSTETGVGTGSPVISAFHRMTGDVSHIYGLANIDALSPKRQRTLPVNCRVYDLLNFASEVATHHADEHGARALQGWLGTIISGEYDLENSCDAFDDFQDFFLDRKLDGETAMDLQRVGR
jgi:hypothetical protein